PHYGTYWDPSPLEAAAQSGFGEIVVLLLERGATVATGSYGPLRFAVQRGFGRVVTILLGHTRRLNRKLHDETWHPLSVAAQHGQEEVVRILLAASVGSCTELCDALNEAAEHGHSTIVRLLFEELRDGLEVFAMSPGPMLFAMRGGHDHIVQQLWELGFTTVEASESPWATFFASGEYPRKTMSRYGDGESEEGLLDAS
ncbi:hypothetical protein LTS18_007514, partial [Coniosporium uncinatum]